MISTPHANENCQESNAVNALNAYNTEGMMNNLELGFGTNYEKEIFAEIISNMAAKYRMQSFFNFPKNGLLGNSKDITKTLSEKNDNPDLLWNFCEFENEKDLQTFFKSLENFKPKYILIVTQNWRNPGVMLHFLYHKTFGKKWDHGKLKNMTTKPIEEYSEMSNKYQVLEKGLFDAPWFVLDVYEVGKFLKKLVPKSKQINEEAQKSIFESSPMFIKKWASHHNYVLLKTLQ
jgi:hypothetical protein